MRNLRRTLLCLTAATLVASAPAHAQDDGGTESTLAQGAGNRALALGGAFTAVADDASALAWNPAGLGRLQRRELVASQASLYGLDVSEQSVSFGWPSWRWGAGAASVRRIGVDGIERRDSRNVLLGEFENSDTELALSYGRAVGDAWYVGATFKLHRQEIAGYSDTGIGTDLGVLFHPGLAMGRDAPWARRLTVGVVLRNAIQPTIRLDEEDVADPLSVRSGVAYHLPFLTNGHVLAALDLEKPRDAGMDVHAGLEIAPHPLLAIRTGWNGDHFTAGTGIQWRLYRFDYVYEDNEIDPVHRFGVSLGFGATVSDTRLAAAASEEEAFRQRLEETFERRRHEQVNELLARGDSRLAQGDVNGAMEIVSAVRALAPDDARATTMEASCLARSAETTEAQGDFADAAILWGRVLAVVPGDEVAARGLVRCRTESDRREERTARIQDLFAQALDAFTTGDFALAQVHLSDILQLAPGDGDAQTMLTRTKDAILSRVNALLARARNSMDREVLDAAADQLAEARTLNPNAEGLAALETRLRVAERTLLRRQRDEQLARTNNPRVTTPAPTIVVKAPALSRKRRKEITDLYRRGMQAMGDERPDDALRYWEIVWLADPEFQNVADFLKREYLLRGLESFSQGGLNEAIRLWEKARDVDPTDEKTLGYLSRAREQANRSQEILGE